VTAVLLLALSLLALHAFLAVCLQRLAGLAAAGPAWWAWVPGANLALVARLAGRSPAWCALLPVPAVNVLVWGLLWAEACRRLGRPPWLAAPLCVPVVNLGVLAHLAGLSPARAVAAVALLLLVAVPAAVGAQRTSQRARTDAGLRGLAGPDADERRAAAAALARSGAAARAAGALAGALRDPDERVRAEAARGLEALAPAAAGALDALVAALDDASGVVRGRAARALWAARAGGLSSGSLPREKMVAALLESARETDGGDMPDSALVLALAAYGAPAPERLAAALADPDFRVRWHAAAGLMQLRRAAREAAPALRRAMDDEEWPVRNAAGRALEDVADEPDVAMLAQALQDDSVETRYHAARALARVGPGSAAAVPVLVAALRDPDWEVRMESAWALAAVGGGAASAEPALLAALRDPDPQVRASVAWALAGIGGSKDAAVPALRRALSDGAREAREAAAGALAQLEGRAR
jgi:HEAT repeat protein